MKDDESFNQFYYKLTDVGNTSFNLREKIYDSKVMRKIIRSFLEIFKLKVTIVKESKDVDTLRLNELVENLKIYKATHHNKKKL